MHCLEFRRLAAAEPQRSDAEREAHERTCPACADFSRQMRSLDTRIATALRIPVTRSEARPVRFGAQSNRRFAVAAGVLLAFMAATLVWFLTPRATLAADVLTHLQHEPGSWAAAEPVPAAALAAIEEKAGVQIDPAIGPVTYAQACWFRGHWVLHLVIHDEQGPVTVLVLAHEQVSSETRFSQGGFSGVILPAPRGAIAVLTRDDARVESIADRVLKALE